MNTKFYKYCAVPMCTSTSIKTPNKLFVYLPQNPKIRKQWFRLARRDKFPKSKNVYFCEDHFDMPNDMDNYMQYHITGSVSQIRMKPDCLPSKFNCQPDRKTLKDMDRPTTVKRQRKALIEKCLINQNQAAVLQECTSSNDNEKQPMESPELQQTVYNTTDMGVQVYIRPKYRSKSTQTEFNYRNKQTSPIKALSANVSTSPFKVEQLKPNIKTRPSISGLKNVEFIKDNVSDSDSVYTPSIISQQSIPISSDNSSMNEIEKQLQYECNSYIHMTLNKIRNKPLFYTGIPESCFFIIKIIEEHTKIPEKHILLCLKKIRRNITFLELGDDFGISKSYAGKIFMENIPMIAQVMRPFIIKLNTMAIKKRLPMAFRHNYYNVSCIIDCLEIEIEKPSRALHQSLTWSEYKKTNTMKYLISSTPNGLVNYISPGYGGRISDACLVENCDFLRCLPSGTCVMADRGFKHIEQLLQQAGCRLVRPPSVETGGKLTKLEVKRTKQIASLRIHIERVIRRIREFLMLKMHSCINNNLIGRLDDIITIVCGLINLQNSIVKK